MVLEGICSLTQKLVESPFESARFHFRGFRRLELTFSGDKFVDVSVQIAAGVLDDLQVSDMLFFDFVSGPNESLNFIRKNLFKPFIGTLLQTNGDIGFLL